MVILKIHQISIVLLMQGLFFMNAHGQYTEYKLGPKGDTINAVNKKGDKEGKWTIRVEEIRGEPGYEEEGLYKKGKKEGAWRKYTLMGDLIAIENYFLGGKSGTQQYFTFMGDMIREEQWRGFNPDAPYDTIPVYGTGSNEILSYKIVKAEQYSVKHGEWRYFESGTGRLLKTEQYLYNRLVDPNENKAAPAATAAAPAEKKKPAKTAEMLEWEKKNKGKKKVLRDGRTGT